MRLDSNQNAVEGIDAPTEKDVLCGRGKPIQDHAGNKRFLSIVNTHREAYQTASSRAEKKRITYQVMGIVNDYGGRFLQLDPDTKKYYVVGEDFAREKVSHALRNRKIDSINSSATSMSSTATASTAASTASGKSSTNNNATQNIVGEEQVAFHGVLLTKQREIFKALVDSDNVDEPTDMEDPTEQDVEETTEGSSNAAVRVQDSETFDELLRRQKVIFQNLVLHDETGGDNGRIIPMMAAPVSM